MTRGAQEALTEPAYSVREVSKYLGIPPSTLTTWTLGRSYPPHPSRRKKAFEPIIRIAAPEARLLSFQNLVEAYVLNALRRVFRIKFESIRTAVANLERRFESDHPLSDHRIYTDRRDIYVEIAGEYENVTSGQVHLPILESYLERVERSSHGVAIRIYPVTRADVLRSPSKIAIEPNRRFGRPYVMEAGVETSAIAERFAAGDSITLLTKEFRCSAEAIEEALRYERVA